LTETFVDTSFVIAVVNRRNQHHAEAVGWPSVANKTGCTFWVALQADSALHDVFLITRGAFCGIPRAAVLFIAIQFASSKQAKMNHPTKGEVPHAESTPEQSHLRRVMALNEVTQRLGHRRFISANKHIYEREPAS